MFTLKGALYLLTFTCALIFASWEMRLKRQMTERLLQDNESVGDMGLLSNIKEEIRRENLLNRLPNEGRVKLRTVVGLKFFFVLAFILEVVFLQK
jgi:hypothetical protein